MSRPFHEALTQRPPATEGGGAGEGRDDQCRNLLHAVDDDQESPLTGWSAQMEVRRRVALELVYYVSSYSESE